MQKRPRKSRRLQQSKAYLNSTPAQSCQTSPSSVLIGPGLYTASSSLCTRLCSPRPAMKTVASHSKPSSTSLKTALFTFATQCPQGEYGDCAMTANEALKVVLFAIAVRARIAWTTRRSCPAAHVGAHTCGGKAGLSTMTTCTGQTRREKDRERA